MVHMVLTSIQHTGRSRQTCLSSSTMYPLSADLWSKAGAREERNHDTVLESYWESARSEADSDALGPTATCHGSQEVLLALSR